MNASQLTTPRARVIAFIVIVFVAAGVWMIIANLLQTQRTSSVGFDSTAELKIRIDSGSVKLQPSTAQQFLVERKDNFVFRTPDVTEGVKDGQLELSSTCPGPRLGTCASDYVVSVPMGTRVNVETTSGSVDATDLRDAVDIKTKSGDVKAAQLGGALKASTQSGSVELNELVSPEIQVTTKSGSVTGETASGPERFDVTTASGDVDLKLPENFGPYRVDATSNTGVATVDVGSSPNASRQVTVRSESGAVVIKRSE